MVTPNKVYDDDDDDDDDDDEVKYNVSVTFLVSFICLATKCVNGFTRVTQNVKSAKNILFGGFVKKMISLTPLAPKIRKLRITKAVFAKTRINVTR